MPRTPLFVLVAALIGCGDDMTAGPDAGEPVEPGGDELAAEDTTLPAPTAVATFHSIGLYWSGAPAPRDSDGVDARIAYRGEGESAWRTGLSLWYDARDQQYRGSLLHLKPATTYQIKITLDGGAYRTITARTWSNAFPIARTVTLPARSTTPLVIDQSGTPDGYVLYAPATGATATIDVGKAHDFDVVVNAHHVIIRGLVLRGARHSGILLGPSTSRNTADVHDVVIEGNDISAWGTNATNDPACVASHPGALAYGANMQSAIFSRSSLLRRVVVQRNKLHHPSTNANSWKEYNCASKSFHPNGPQAISLFDSEGQHVIRYNEISSDATHYFNDAMGETNNFSTRGFPNRDSDIYGNLVRHCWDDGLELEGGDANVRVWGNYIDQTYIKIGLAPVARGPIYIWRNVGGSSRTSPVHAYSQGFFKSRDRGGSTYVGGGRVYIYNNTVWRSPTGAVVASFISEYDEANRLDNYRVANNVIQVDSPSKQYAIREAHAYQSSFDYDLIAGKTAFSTPQEAHAFLGAPVFAPGDGFDEATRTGSFALAPGSRGQDHGQVIPNITDGYLGPAPDPGAHESGRPAMEFGVDAYR